MRVAVIGHVEWVEFVRVESVPRPGDIVHALETWDEAAGGGAVAAVQLARLAGACTLFTSFGADELGRRARLQLAEQGVTVRAMADPSPQRRAVVFVDDVGERTITVLGDKLVPSGGDSRLPWQELEGADAAFFVSGDAESVHAARRPRIVVTTSGPLGGWVQPGGPFRPASLPGPVVDAYGCGDSFAAGLTFALARGDSIEEAVALGARCGAAVMTGRGPYGAQLAASDLD